MHPHKTISLSNSNNGLTEFYEKLGIKTEQTGETVQLFSNDNASIFCVNPLISILIRNTEIINDLLKRYDALNIKHKDIVEIKKQLHANHDLNNVESPLKFFSIHPSNLNYKYIITEDPNNNKLLLILRDRATNTGNNNKNIAILTSGGDSPGMNSCIRSCIRTSLKHEITPYIIYEGYKGLITNNISKASFTDSPNINEGGTSIKSARCPQFLKQFYRIKGTIHLITRNIGSVIVLGGDGSFKGAEMFHDEWNTNVEIISKIYNSMNIDSENIDMNCLENCLCFDNYNSETNSSNDSSNSNLSDKINKASEIKKIDSIINKQDSADIPNSMNVCKIKQIICRLSDKKLNNLRQYLSTNMGNKSNQIKIIGIPCTIDNDVPLCKSLGFDSALHRVIESVDNLIYTMASHNRAFVIQVMGRDCGYIAVCSGLALGADYVLCSEYQRENWKSELLLSVLSKINSHNISNNTRSTKNGDNKIIIVLPEGAKDSNGLIKPDDVKDLLIPFVDTRILTLGHLQRGGRPSASDRLDGTFLGLKAIETIIQNIEYTKLVYLNTSSIVSTDLQINRMNGDEHPKIFNNSKFGIIDLFSTEYLRYDSKLERRNKKFKIAKLSDINHLTEITNKLVTNKKYDELFKFRGKVFANSIRVLEGFRITNNVKNDKLCICIENYIMNSNDLPNIGSCTNLEENVLCSSFFIAGPNDIHKLANLNIKRIESDGKKRIAIILEGYRCAGMHTTLKSIIKYSRTSSHSIILVHDGFNGLMKDRFENITNNTHRNIKDIDLFIGTSPLKGRQVTRHYTEKILNKLKEHKIDSVILIGSASCISLMKYVKKIQQTKKNDERITKNGENSRSIEMILIPLSISSNIPLTESIGQDTSLNSIVNMTGILSKTRMTFHNTVSIVELGGSNGSLCLLAAIASGSVIIPEYRKNKTRNQDITTLANMLQRKFSKTVECSLETCSKNKLRGFKCSDVSRSGLLIMRQKDAIPHLTSNSLCALLESDSFRTDYCVLGQLERGGGTSPFDRILSVLMGVHAFEFIDSGSNGKVGLVSSIGDTIEFVDISRVSRHFNLRTGKSVDRKWLNFAELPQHLEC